MDEWKFKDPKNLAVISTRKIFSGGGWIAYASHDADDESWQFYGDEAEIDHDDLILVGLFEVVELDETVAQLADLPLGWHARRDTKNSPWRRSKKPPQPPEMELS
ncbi:hypothetical protein C1D09_014700 [Mesorhizobium intechi]|uniref:DUF2185 domain-containing protein n=1 Tax=Mesorhizobium intechi TaxID=537601 RepID=A0A8T9APY8_9HYPH|nr:hypothetical protein [Mesorhizobium intechi]TSE10595.1 hypothetical protein C1D09_014700 [Mesorhizobium intechi]